MFVGGMLHQHGWIYFEGWATHCFLTQALCSPSVVQNAYHFFVVSIETLFFRHRCQLC